MAVFGIILVFVGGFLLGLGAAWHYQPVTPPERTQAMIIELRALRAAQRLSLLAWQTRQSIREERHRGTDGLGQ